MSTRHAVAGTLPHMLLRSLLDVLTPPRCLACDRPPPARDVLCAGCRAAFEWLGPETCRRCGLPGRCGGRCPARGMAFSAAWAPVAYGGPAAALVVGLKDRGVLAAASVMAAQIAAVVPPGLVDGGVLVPVPADPVRRRRRGVDHALALAGDLAVRRGLPVERVLRRRTSRGGHAARGGRAERLRTDRLAVEVRGRAPEIAVLVDDVHTTGATLNACARALRARGTRSVLAVSYARTLPTGRFGRTLGET